MILSGAVVAVDNKCALEKTVYGNAMELRMFLVLLACIDVVINSNSDNYYYY